MEEKISEYDFVVRAIKRLKKPPYKGIHSVYSGFRHSENISIRIRLKPLQSLLRKERS